MTKLEQLTQILDNKQFHHATYRDLGKLWEGLHIYVRSTYEEGGFRGYKHSGLSFPKDHPELEQANEMLRNTGISLGSYGQG